jgi:hypothetical protein
VTGQNCYISLEARYDLGGKVKYLVYQSPQRLANRRVQMRTRVKRVYFPGDASQKITVGDAGWYRNLRGRKVFGVPVRYRYVLAPAIAHRGNTRVHLPRRSAQRTKIVPLSRHMDVLRLTGRPPKGPLQAVA